MSGRVLALVYRSRGETEKSKQVLERALKVFPGNEVLGAELASLRGAAPPAASAAKPVAPPAARPVVTAPVPTSKPGPPPSPSPSLTAVPALAFAGLTLGASVADLLALERLPKAPALQEESAVAGLMPPDPCWGRLPLSTIMPAFVYGQVPPPGR